jgi:hypothetical protein
VLVRNPWSARAHMGTRILMFLVTQANRLLCWANCAPPHTRRHKQLHCVKNALAPYKISHSQPLTQHHPSIHPPTYHCLHECVTHRHVSLCHSQVCVRCRWKQRGQQRRLWNHPLRRKSKHPDPVRTLRFELHHSPQPAVDHQLCAQPVVWRCWTKGERVRDLRVAPDWRVLSGK